MVGITFPSLENLALLLSLYHFKGLDWQENKSNNIALLREHS